MYPLAPISSVLGILRKMQTSGDCDAYNLGTSKFYLHIGSMIRGFIFSPSHQSSIKLWALDYTVQKECFYAQCAQHTHTHTCTFSLHSTQYHTVCAACMYIHTCHIYTSLAAPDPQKRVGWNCVQKVFGREFWLDEVYRLRKCYANIHSARSAETNKKLDGTTLITPTDWF